MLRGARVMLGSSYAHHVASELEVNQNMSE